MHRAEWCNEWVFLSAHKGNPLFGGNCGEHMPGTWDAPMGQRRWEPSAPAVNVLILSFPCEGPRMEPSLKPSCSSLEVSAQAPLSFWWCPFTSSLHTPGPSTLGGPLGYLNVLNVPSPPSSLPQCALSNLLPFLSVPSFWATHPETSDTHTHSKALVTENS